MMRWLAWTLVVLSIGWGTGCENGSPESPPDGEDPLTELRGVWLTNVDSDVLDSQASIEDAMAFLAEHHFNVVFPVVWNNGVTLYPSEIMADRFDVSIDPAYEGRDPLAEIIEAADKHDLAVVPWFEFGFAARHAESTPTDILEHHPEWAARTPESDPVVKNDFHWMNAFHPDVEDFVVGLMQEVATTYDVAGVQGDDRLPAQPVEGGYAPQTVEQYQADHDGADPPSDPHEADWKAWRADQLNAIAERIYGDMKAISPTLQVSWSPSIYPWGYDEYLQEWPSWLRNGHADWVHPQVYRRDTTAYRETLEDQLPDAVDLPESDRARIYPGVLLQVGDYRMTPDEAVQVVRTNRDMNLHGEVFFFYEGLRANDDEVANALAETVYQQSASWPEPR
ncbi:MAG: family 10 glycosylhydrolase [Longimonas sp.]|uniref:glycoside hydrolase family 10 protein n=1 Tax=Longimonas sp. TaxID=2039626 RepID=UPI003975F7D7